MDDQPITDLEVRPAQPIAPVQQQSVQNATNVTDLIRMALLTPEIPAEKLTSLYQLQRQVRAEDAETEFNLDFARLQLALPRIPKNGIIDMGTKGKMNFARWEDMDTAIRPILNAHNFTLSFSSEPMPGAVLMVCTLTHAKGHSRTSKMQLPPDSGAGRNGLQAMGSSRSYGKRYLAADILNLVFESQDNDGKTAEAITQQEKDSILDILKEMGTDPKSPKFLKWLHDGWGAESVSQIQRVDFKAVMSALEDKRRAKQ